MDHTARRMARPTNITFAGGNGCRINHQRCGTSIDAFRCTKPKGSVRRESIQCQNNIFERFHDSAIASLEFAERSCLLLQHCGHSLYRVAMLEFLGERMVDQRCAPSGVSSLARQPRRGFENQTIVTDLPYPYHNG